MDPLAGGYMKYVRRFIGENASCQTLCMPSRFQDKFIRRNIGDAVPCVCSVKMLLVIGCSTYIVTLENYL
jgi:hypothetical protein